MVTTVEFENCGLCSKVINEDLSLPCLHSFCKSCLLDHAKKATSTGSRVHCPLCRSKFPLNEDDIINLPSLYFTANHLKHRSAESTDLSKCEVCDAISSELHYCSICQQFFCSNCKVMHSRTKISASHTYLSFEEGNQLRKSNPNRSTYCSRHSNLEISYVCDEGGELICSQCAAEFHSGHHFKKLEVIAEDFKKDIMAKSAEIKKRQLPLEETIDNLRTILQEIESHSQECEKLVQIKMQELRDLINQREKTLLSGIADIRQKKGTKIQIQKSDLEDIHLSLVSSLQFIETVVKKGTGAEIGFSKKQILERLASLKALSYSLEPVQDSKIKFDFEQFSSLSEEIKEFGTIITSEVATAHPSSSRTMNPPIRGETSISAETPISPETPISAETPSPVRGPVREASASQEKISQAKEAGVSLLFSYQEKKYKLEGSLPSSSEDLKEYFQKKCKGTITKIEYGLDGQTFVPLTTISELQGRAGKIYLRGYP